MNRIDQAEILYGPGIQALKQEILTNGTYTSVLNALNIIQSNMHVGQTKSELDYLLRAAYEIRELVLFQLITKQRGDKEKYAI